MLSTKLQTALSKEKPLPTLKTPNKFQATIAILATKTNQIFHMFGYQRRFGRVVGLALQTVRAISKAASYLRKVILLIHHPKPTRPLITLLPHISRPSFGLAHICGRLGSHPWATVLLLVRLTYSHWQLLFPFFLSSLFPCLSSLNLSSSCCSIASPVLCSAVLITVPFSCQETEYDEDMWRGREHLLTQSEHQTMLYKVLWKV